MGVSKSFNAITQRIYKQMRALARKYYLTKAARHNTNRKIDKKYKQTIIDYYKPFIKVDTVFHAVYKQFTGIEDARFIPDDVFANYIDRYYNIGQKAVVLENKCYFEKMFSGVKQPKCLAMRLNGIWFSDERLVSFDSIKKNIVGQNSVVKQACGSGGGHDVYFLNENDTVEYFEGIINSIHDDIIIQQPIRQHSILANINPSSVNTIRVLSMLTDDGVKVYSCFLRCGRNGSKVDNASMGGLICGIDKDTGHLRHLAYSLKNYHEQYEAHPDTGIVFSNVTIPSWNKIIDLVKVAAPQVPHSRMVAWDITIDESGDPVLIEANLNDSLVSAHQLVNGPIFKEDTEKILKEVFNHRR